MKEKLFLSINLRRSAVLLLMVLFTCANLYSNWWDFLYEEYGDYDIPIYEHDNYYDFMENANDYAVDSFHDAITEIYYEDSYDSDYAWNGYIPTSTTYGEYDYGGGNDYQFDDDFYYEEDEPCDDPCFCWGDCDDPVSANEDQDTSTDQENLLDRLLKMFKRGTTLNKEEKEKLEDAYKKMRDECIYEYIDNYLQSQNVSLGSIYIADPGWMGQAAVTNSGDLKFADSNEITAEALKHEWFHLYQKEYHSLSSYTEPGMMEWEQALFRDILMYIKAGGNTESIAYNWACSRTGKEGYRIEYLDWLSTLTNKGTTFPNNIDNSNFEHYADVFGDVSITYNKSRGYNYSNTNYKPTAIQSIFAGAEKHCQ